MLIIGLCGGSGSGKGTVADLFRIRGINSIDADALYHNLTKSGSELTVKLSQHFGQGIINQDGSLNRKALGDIVFSDSSGKSLQELNSITHSEVINAAELIMNQARLNGERAIIFDAPLLFESGFNKKCDLIISVIADEKLRIERIIKRDGIDKDAATKRIRSQKTNDFLIANSDFAIINNGDFSALADEVNEIYKKIFK